LKGRGGFESLILSFLEEKRNETKEDERITPNYSIL